MGFFACYQCFGAVGYQGLAAGINRISLRHMTSKEVVPGKFDHPFVNYAAGFKRSGLRYFQALPADRTWVADQDYWFPPIQ